MKSNHHLFSYIVLIICCCVKVQADTWIQNEQNEIIWTKGDEMQLRNVETSTDFDKEIDTFIFKEDCLYDSSKL